MENEREVMTLEDALEIIKKDSEKIIMLQKKLSEYSTWQTAELDYKLRIAKLEGQVSAYMDCISEIARGVRYNGD
ncbi:MAG: hypothetical protein IJ642_00590 [Oscillospiraceae bacterium]|nr:hypothetical protein [Oscillospiraceae bacterium]